MTPRLIAALALGWVLAGPAAAAQYAFAALGDTPYNADEEARFVPLIAELNSNDLAFVIHIGDFKSGWSDCSDELYRERREWFALSHHPFIYVPGDNDWADCWRGPAGGYRPAERLSRLRELFFSQPQSLGQRAIELEQQPRSAAPRPYPEHARWIHQGILLLTINVPGGDNNMSRDRAEFAARDAALREWIRSSFRMARSRQLTGLVVAMHANPWAAGGPRRRGFAQLLETLIGETRDFPGEVLLIHGDTHRFRVDRPLIDPDTQLRIPNFTRIEVFGSPSINWVRVRVDATGGSVKFSAQPGS